MLKTNFSRLMLVLLITVAGGIAWAATSQVTSDIVNSGGALNSNVLLPLKISSLKPVAGINGEFVYDPTYFSDPAILPGGGAPSFTFLGNLVSPGHFKFVIYSDPVKSMDPTWPVAMFQVKVIKRPAKSTTSVITFGTPAAGDTSAASLSTTFSNINIKLNANGVNDWALYE